MKRHRSCLFLGFLALSGLVPIVVAGCSGQPKAKPVNAPLARTTLQKVLDTWKTGGKPEDLQTSSPPIFANDLDWLTGRKLISYELEGDGDARDANLFCVVNLQLEDPDTGPTERSATYCIGTDPQLTVHRVIP